jgi:hypothetical protein
MATGIVVHPVAKARLKELKGELEDVFGVETTEKAILAAATHGATAASLVGMLVAFTKAKKAYDDAAKAAKMAKPQPPATPQTPSS